MPNPTIALVNHSSVPLPFTTEQLAAALVEYAGLFGPVWSSPVAGVICRSEWGTEPLDLWPLFFADTTDDPQALAYHTVTDRPWGVVFVKTTLEHGESLSAAAGHEFIEMVVDPWCNRILLGQDGIYRAGEPADPTQGMEFYAKNSLLLPNFVYPEWFGYKNGASDEGQKDFLAQLHKDGQLCSEGYISVWNPWQGWIQQFGQQAEAKVATKLAATQSRLVRRQDRCLLTQAKLNSRWSIA